jgi:Stress responsive A/B Barrel Domain
MIRHTVVFRLRHAPDSDKETAFLDDARTILTGIPGVERFEQLREVSPKNDYAFGFSMEFADHAAYEGYNGHPDHVAFVRDRWMKEVEDFLEIDYAPL